MQVFSTGDLTPFHVYSLISRNLNFGVWNPETSGFTGVREKFGDLYLFEEYHWDTGEPYGTATPLEDVADFSKIQPDKWLLELLKIELLSARKELWEAERAQYKKVDK